MRRTFYSRERNRPQRLGPGPRAGLTSLLIASGLLGSLGRFDMPGTIRHRWTEKKPP